MRLAAAFFTSRRSPVHCPL